MHIDKTLQKQSGVTTHNYIKPLCNEIFVLLHTGEVHAQNHIYDPIKNTL